MKNARGTKKKRDKTTTIETLPQDLIVEIVVRLVSDSAEPIYELKDLRMVCKMFRAASEAKLVGQRIPVERLRGIRWWNKEFYFASLRNCAAAGNLEACFILGLENLFNLGDMNLGSYYLNEAMVGGHSGATYLRGILLFGDPQTRQTGIEILKKISDGADDSERMKICDLYVKECWMEFSNAESTNASRNRYSQRMKERCTNPKCGKLDGWEQRRSFCSELCKWTFEYLILCLYM